MSDIVHYVPMLVARMSVIRQIPCGRGKRKPKDGLVATNNADKVTCKECLEHLKTLPPKSSDT